MNTIIKLMFFSNIQEDLKSLRQHQISLKNTLKAIPHRQTL